uniref:Uncharacterized protein n=1 Tax=viral metagenome TaxID=1070528 RepID=A0A6C0E638_9ZZZZ
MHILLASTGKSDIFCEYPNLHISLNKPGYNSATSNEKCLLKKKL